MRIGICLPQIGFGASPAVVDEFVNLAESSGFDSLWVEEHLFRPLVAHSSFGGVAGATWPIQHQQLMGPFELLAYVAGRTEHCKIGTSIVVAGYHHPVDLAKRSATIDQLSRGRMMLGVGAGWCEDEFDLLGSSFADRGAIASEMLEALLACWGPNPVELSGGHFTVPQCETSPKPFTGQRIPLVGGFSGRAGRLRTARFCDVWQPYAIEPNDARSQCDRLNEVAQTSFNRGPLELSLRVAVYPEIPGLMGGGKASPGRWAGDIVQLSSHVRAAIDAGCDELVMDTSFAPGDGSEKSWVVQPLFFQPLVEIAHSA